MFTKLLGELAFHIPGLTSILTSKMTTELGPNGNCFAYLDQDVRELGRLCPSTCEQNGRHTPTYCTRTLSEGHKDLLQLLWENLTVSTVLHVAEIGRAAETSPLLHDLDSLYTLMGISACRR